MSFLLISFFAIVACVAWRRLQTRRAEREAASKRLPGLCAELLRLSAFVLALHEELCALRVPVPLISRRRAFADAVRISLVEWRVAAYRAVNNESIDARQRVVLVEEAIVGLRQVEEAIHRVEVELNSHIHRWAEQEYHSLMPLVRSVNDGLIREMSKDFQRSYEVLLATPNPARNPCLSEAFVASHFVVYTLAQLWARDEITKDPSIN